MIRCTLHDYANVSGEIIYLCLYDAFSIRIHPRGKIRDRCYIMANKDYLHSLKLGALSEWLGRTECEGCGTFPKRDGRFERLYIYT